MPNTTESKNYIAQGIQHLAIPMSSITPDPANVRLHSPRNIEAISQSLLVFRQQTPIVIDKNNIIRKGNGTYQAAKILGWDYIAAIQTDLQGLDLVGYGIADNRTGDPETGSIFDKTALADTLEALANEPSFDATATGFTLDEIANLIAAQTPPEGGKPLDDAALAAAVETVTCPKCGEEVPL